MKTTIATAFIICLSYCHGQHQVVELSFEEDPNEISIAIDGRDPRGMIAGANINSIYRSSDGGVTWTRSSQTSEYGVWGDPVIIQDTAGAFYHFHLSRYEGGEWIDRLVCQRSEDGGRTFTGGTYFGLNGKKAQDKPWAITDPKTNSLYVTWTQFDKYDSKNPEDRSNILFSRSDDGGITWSDPIQINEVSGDCRDDDDTVEGAVPAVGPDGQIYVAWSGPNGLVFNRSFDGGRTWEEKEIKIAELPGGWNIEIPGIYRANGMPVTKCDLSDGPYRGRIYVNWVDLRNGDENADVFLAYSDDKGSTWSDPIRVNQDKTDRHQFFTWMDVDRKTGVVWFVFHDRQKHEDENTDVALAWTSDGGQTFGHEIISDSAFTPHKAVFFGDYNNIAAYNNVVRPVWTRLDGKRLSVRTAIIDSDLILEPENEILEISTSDKGSLIVRLNNNGLYSLKLFDLTGELRYEMSDLQLDGRPFTIPLTHQLEDRIHKVELSSEDEVFRRLWIRN